MMKTEECVCASVCVFLFRMCTIYSLHPSAHGHHHVSVVDSPGSLYKVWISIPSNLGPTPFTFHSCYL